MRTAFGNGAGTVFDAGQGQQLIRQVRQAVGALGGRFQGAAPGGRFFGTQAQFQPGLERRQGGAQLVGSVGNKLRLALELPAQTFGEMVERAHQWAELILNFH